MVTQAEKNTHAKQYGWKKKDPNETCRVRTYCVEMKITRDALIASQGDWNDGQSQSLIVRQKRKKRK